MKSAKSKSLTAAELMASLHKNREFIARQAEQEQQNKALEQSLYAEEEPLILSISKLPTIQKSVKVLRVL